MTGENHALGPGATGRRHQGEGPRARRVGIREMILPRQNEKNIKEDLTEELRSELTIHYVSHIEEVLKLALTPGAAQTHRACRWTWRSRKRVQ
jgi:predicted ATP-dependent protease